MFAEPVPVESVLYCPNENDETLEELRVTRASMAWEDLGLVEWTCRAAADAAASMTATYGFNDEGRRRGSWVRWRQRPDPRVLGTMTMP